MLVVLYALLSNVRTEWHMTICEPIDCRKWASDVVLKVDPPLPISYASQWIQSADTKYTINQLDILADVMADDLRSFAKVGSWPVSITDIITVNKEFYHQMSHENQAMPIQIDDIQYDKFCTIIGGRSLFPNELSALLNHHHCQHASDQWQVYAQQAYLDGRIKFLPGIQTHVQTKKIFLFEKKTVTHRCSRCGATSDELIVYDCDACGYECLYCSRCLNMGRAGQCSILICGTKRNDAVYTTTPLNTGHWQLTPAQSQATQAALAFLNQTNAPSDSPAFLLWAVTGAGKTEMIYPLLQSLFQHQKKVALVTPRKDVVLELLPRLLLAFPEKTIIALYGGSKQTWQNAELIVATTHQMFRFYGAFDTVIIDEIDAFPYHNNPMLTFAVEKSLHQTGRYIYLSATPPANLVKAVRNHRLPHAIVPSRFHGYPLPVPRRCVMPRLNKQINSGYLASKWMQLIKHSLERGARLFLFVPYIGQVGPLVYLLEKMFSVSVNGTSSQDPQRTETVKNFRAGLIQLLVTTTILERGVTVPFVDVYILDADSQQFDSAALIQMAGRAGRSQQDPNGFVYFCAADWTSSQKEAVQQIRDMNRRASKAGAHA